MLEHHLTLCDGCVAYVEQMRETRRLTGTLDIDDVPEAGVERLMDAFRAYQVERANGPGGLASGSLPSAEGVE